VNPSPARDPAAAAADPGSAPAPSEAPGPLAALGSIAWWLLVAVIAVALFPVALLVWAATVAFDPQRRLQHQFTTVWAALYTWLNPVWRVEVRGRERIDPRRAYVMVANHNSLVDIFVLYRLWTHFKWVSKVENFAIPCIGWNMRLNDYVPLVRGQRSSVLQMMDHCRAHLRRGSSVMIFPEGTRSKTGRMRPFKPGAFELALAERLPVLPIAVTGTADAARGKAMWVRPARMTVTVLPAIEPSEFGTTDPEALAARVRGVIAAHVPGDHDADAPPLTARGDGGRG
jgi:1-acyl-sn-glycerol-3-phosphate acyltransferase